MNKSFLVSLLTCSLLLTLRLVAYGQTVVWVQTNGPTGGFVAALCQMDSTVFAGGIGGVFLSTQEGNNWQSAGLPQTYVTCLARKDTILFAGTQRHKLYRSSNRGISWTQLGNGLPGGQVTGIIIKDTLVFASIFDYGVYRSTNLGNDWISVNIGINNYSIRKLILSHNTLIATAAGASGSGIFRSTDDGISWSRIDPDPYAWTADAICVFADTLYGARFSNQAKVYKSTDDGLTWFLPTGSQPPSDIILSLFADSTALFAGTYLYGLFKSTNFGISWTAINQGLYNRDIYTLFGVAGSLFSGSFDGIHKSTDLGGNWTPINHGLTNALVISTWCDADTVYAGTYGGGLYRSTDRGQSWTNINLGIYKPYIHDIIRIGTYRFVIASHWTYGGTILRSTNDGTTWTQQTSGIDAGELKAIHGTTQMLYVATSYGAFRSSNWGVSWQLMVNGLPNNGRPNVSSVAALDSIVVAANGESQIYRSTNLGADWTAVSVEPGVTPPIERVDVIGSTFYAGCSQVNVVFQSTDRGATWQRIQVPLSNSSVTKFVGDENRVFAALSSGGVIGKLGPSEPWTTLNTGLTNQDVRTLCISSNALCAGTWGGGTFLADLPTSVTPPPGTNMPAHYSLSQNFPNPFNPSTTIQFSLPNPEFVRLTICNLLGQEIVVLLAENLSTGNYTVQWAPNHLPSGVYLYRLQAGSYTETRKLMLLR